ncbi:hypothetical protein BDW74DRAFT_172515 [Aspergillus multicolor]|uniref:oxygen-dependent protoporphyrinogen oxidase n=1 Tax=Aspergillus multicolor TaxID=41759 RepID=UPI003CCDD878
MAALPLLDLIWDLGLEDQFLLTSKSSPASQNRYIYYPDHLVRMPAPRKGASALSLASEIVSSLCKEPVFEDVLASFCKEPFVKIGTMAHRHSHYPADESVKELISRRLSPKIAENLVSSVFHGIYAGDIDRLSADTLLGSLRLREFRSGSILRDLFRFKNLEISLEDDWVAASMLRRSKPKPHRDLLKTIVDESSTLTFKDGVGQLVDTLASELKRSPKVEVVTCANVTSIQQDPTNSDLRVKVENGKQRIHNRLIATNPPRDLARQLQSTPDHTKHPTLAINALREHNYATTTMVVNLYYSNPDLIPTRGFGYLIPRSISFAQNPERALGVIFASESSIGQDTVPGTKLTVMMGGHYWDGYQESDYPDHHTAVSMAQSLLKRHLGITDSPTVTRTRLQRDAIPQPTVGHQKRMHDISKYMRSELDQRVTVAGAWYSRNGTGVVDSIRQAYLATQFGIQVEEPGIKLNDTVKELIGGGITTNRRWAMTKPGEFWKYWGKDDRP